MCLKKKVKQQVEVTFINSLSLSVITRSWGRSIIRQNSRLQLNGAMSLWLKAMIILSIQKLPADLGSNPSVPILFLTRKKSKNNHEQGFEPWFPCGTKNHGFFCANASVPIFSYLSKLLCFYRGFEHAQHYRAGTLSRCSMVCRIKNS